MVYKTEDGVVNKIPDSMKTYGFSSLCISD